MRRQYCKDCKYAWECTNKEEVDPHRSYSPTTKYTLAVNDCPEYKYLETEEES